MLSAEQSRAARAWLDWSQEDLANAASVSPSTVRDFEKGRRTPIENNLKALRQALEQAGVQLLFDSEGVAAGVAVASYAPPTGLRLPGSQEAASDAPAGSGARARRG